MSTLAVHWSDTVESWSPELRHRHRVLAYALVESGWSPVDAGRLATERILAEQAELEVDPNHGVRIFTPRN